MQKRTAVNNVDEYISKAPQDKQALLKDIRQIIVSAAPKAEESISYMMPTYKQNGPVVYFGFSAKHIGLYPTPSAVTAFKKELTEYKTSKGVIQLPLDKPLPVGLIKKIIKYKIKENIALAKEKAAKKK